MKSKNWPIRVVIISIFLLLSACGSNTKSTHNNTNTHSEKMNMEHGSMDMKDMHSGSGEVPKGLKVEENPTFKVGSKAVVNADHMEGMNGAKATIVGAFDTIAYSVTYKPTTGGPTVKNHKWVIQEEIKNAGNQPLKTGTKVTLEADHMDGMKGAKSTIDSAVKTTVYMIDYTPTTGGQKVKNHKWVTESELSSN